MGNTITGTWTDGKKNIDVKLTIILFKEDETHLVFCPALNLTGYGATEAEAMQSFDVMINEYFHYTTNKNTLSKDLKNLGWKILKNLRKPATPPNMSYLLSTNEDFKRIFDNYDYRKASTNISIPALV
mgnify:CR=1 FL=1